MLSLYTREVYVLIIENKNMPSIQQASKKSMFSYLISFTCSIFGCKTKYNWKCADHSSYMTDIGMYSLL